MTSMARAQVLAQLQLIADVARELPLMDFVRESKEPAIIKAVEGLAVFVQAFPRKG